jgi:hypothetical protein
MFVYSVNLSSVINLIYSKKLGILNYVEHRIFTVMLSDIMLSVFYHVCMLSAFMLSVLAGCLFSQCLMLSALLLKI